MQCKILQHFQKRDKVGPLLDPWSVFFKHVCSCRVTGISSLLWSFWLQVPNGTRFQFRVPWMRGRPRALAKGQVAVHSPIVLQRAPASVPLWPIVLAFWCVGDFGGGALYLGSVIAQAPPSGTMVSRSSCGLRWMDDVRAAPRYSTRCSSQ